MSAPQTTPLWFAPLDDRGDRTNQLHWLELLHTSYISLFNQAGKGRVFYSIDKCFETGADPRNIFDKQILKICRHFNAWFRAWLLRRVWELAPSPDFRNQLACGQKTIGSHLNCPRAYVITYTYQACGLLFVFTFFRLIRCLVDPAFMVSHFNTSLFAAV